jgi:putative membrane protein
MAEDATRRTSLANERTWLAWLRTGLGALAVALAVGKVVPDVADTKHRWPYAVVGVGYAMLGIALVAYGARRRLDVDEALARGDYASADARAIAAFVWATVALGAATAVLVIID